MQARPCGERELADALALARPGAAAGRELYLRRRHGVEPVKHVHERAEPALRGTLGVLLYDDDAITLIESLAGVTGCEADRLRRLFAGGDAAAEGELVAACSRVGVPEQVARVARGGPAEPGGVHVLQGPRPGRRPRRVGPLPAPSVVPRRLLARVPEQPRGPLPGLGLRRGGQAGRGRVLAPCANRSAAGWTQEVASLRAGLDCVRGLGPGAAAALIEDRQRAGPYASFDEAMRRLAVAEHDLAALARAGCFDFAGRGRETLLAGGKLAGRGRPCDAGKGPRPIPPWPLGGMVGVPADRRAGWDMLGFAAGPQMMALARRSLPCGLGDGRTLRAAQGGERLGLAGLVAAVEGSSLVLLDEFGTADVDVTPRRGVAGRGRPRDRRGHGRGASRGGGPEDAEGGGVASGRCPDAEAGGRVSGGGTWRRSPPTGWPATGRRWTNSGRRSVTPRRWPGCWSTAGAVGP